MVSPVAASPVAAADISPIRCGVVGDEKHAIFDCTKIDIRDFSMPEEISEIWKMDDLFDLMGLLKDAG